MITSVNPDNRKFKQDIIKKTYVDKSLIIDKLNNLIDEGENKLCVSRPRRFGKTMTTHLLTAYYSCACDSRKLFENTKLSKVEDWDKYLNKFNIIKIDVQRIYHSVNSKGEDLADAITELVNNDLKTQFGNILSIDVTKPLSYNIINVFNATNRQFVVIMDEYDVLVRDKRDGKVLSNYLELLNSLFKGDDIDDAFALVYLTGIFPIIKDSFESKLNNFREYSIISPKELAGFIGFTEDEVKELCNKFNMNFEECKDWYDGYKLNDEVSVYNPCSVVSSMKGHEFLDYWNVTGSFESISDYLQLNIQGIYDDIRSMIKDNSKVVVDVSDFLNRIDNLQTKNDIFTYLIHIGYLAYDKKNKECYIPNTEIRKQWIKALRKIHKLKHFYILIKASQDIFEGLLNLQSSVVSTNLDIIHHSTGDVNSYGNEAALHTSLVTSMAYAQDYYEVYNEVSSGNGRADIVYVPKNNSSIYPTLIFELKVDESAEKALKQIHDRNYPYNFYHEYKKNMLLIGINYDKKTHKHECIIERYKDDN